MNTFMDDKERERCELWIRKSVIRHCRKTVDAYWLKHVCQAQTGIYCDVHEFADMMKMCGFMNLEGSKYVFYAKVEASVLQEYYK